MSINTAVCLFVCLFVCLSQISSQISSQVSTQPLLWPYWRLLLISCSMQTTGQVYYMCRVCRGWIKQLCKCSKQSACSLVTQYVPDNPVLLLNIPPHVLFEYHTCFLWMNRGQPTAYLPFQGKLEMSEYMLSHTALFNVLKQTCFSKL